MVNVHEILRSYHNERQREFCISRYDWRLWWIFLSALDSVYFLPEIEGVMYWSLLSLVMSFKYYRVRLSTGSREVFPLRNYLLVSRLMRSSRCLSCASTPGGEVDRVTELMKLIIPRTGDIVFTLSVCPSVRLSVRPRRFVRNFVRLTPPGVSNAHKQNLYHTTLQ